MRNRGLFFSGLAAFLCGAAIEVCFASAAPSPLWFTTPHWQDWLAIGVVGLLGMLVGGISMAFAVE